VIERRAHLDPSASESVHRTGASIELRQIELTNVAESDTLHAGATALTSKGGIIARRRYQTGSVILKGSSWYGRYREGQIASDGREVRIRRSILLGSKKELPTKPLAERRMDIILAPINSLAYRPGRVATIEEFAQRWRTEVLSKRKASTVHAAESHLKIQILPLLGKFRLNELGVENQQMFVTRLSGTISRKMLLNVLGTLSSMLTTAQNWGYVCEGLNFRKIVLPEKAITKEPACFTAEQARSIIMAAQGPFRVMFAIAAMTGLRAGEILALQTGDFDFERNFLTVRRSVWRQKSFHSQDFDQPSDHANARSIGADRARTYRDTEK